MIEKTVVSGVQQQIAHDAGENRLLRAWADRRLHRERWLNEYRYRQYRGNRLPDFLVIGCQKGGTTSLFDDLARHPDVAAARDKEIHYFDLNYHMGRNWYRSFFPQAAGGVTGEASPYYLFHPLVPRRVRRLLPRCRLIVLLRDPVERAWSHYRMEVRNGDESLPFEEAIARESERIEAEAARLAVEPFYNSFNHRHFSYLARGLYADQLERWLRLFPPEQMLVMRSEDYFQTPQAVYDRLARFLGIRPHRPETFARSNAGEASGLKPATRKRLSAYFRPANERLGQLLGEDFGWG